LQFVEYKKFEKIDLHSICFDKRYSALIEFFMLIL